MLTVAEVADELPDGVLLLDVREDDEWAAGHAPNALHIPMGELPAGSANCPQDDKLFVICRCGGRSARVTAYLNANGWDAMNVDGGMRAWADTGRPLTCDQAGVPPEVI